jgi:hypothetical protein
MALRKGVYVVSTDRWYIERTVWLIAGVVSADLHGAGGAGQSAVDFRRHRHRTCLHQCRADRFLPDRQCAPPARFQAEARDERADALEPYENLNVAAALGLAGVGAEETRIEVWADPALTRNTHRIEVDADSASFSMMIKNIPSENPKTGRIAAVSIIATLRKLTSPLRIDT